MATYTNKNGTSGIDTLTYNKAGTYHAGAGNDTIKINGGSGVVVYTDSGNNTINVTAGSGHTVKVAAVDADSDKQNGVEKLTINGANQVDAYLGSGKDEITLFTTDGRKSTGALSAIHGGGWTDTFIVNTGAQRYQLYGDAGDDIFNIKGGDNLVCWGGAANDTFTVTGGTNIKLRGGDSADVYNISMSGVDMQLGYGNDVVNVTKGDKQVIKANLGINTINLKAGNGHMINADIDQAASKKAGRDVGYGVDKVYISGTATQVTAFLGDGKDVVDVSSGSGHKIYTEGWGDQIIIDNGVQDSTFDAGDGDDELWLYGGQNNYLQAGEGKDNLTILGGNNNRCDTGAGNDIIDVYGNATNTVVKAGENNDKFFFQDPIYYNKEFNLKGCEFYGENGDDEFQLKRIGYGSYYGGSGADKFDLERSHDMLVNCGDGNDHILAQLCYFLDVYGSGGSDEIILKDCAESVVYGYDEKHMTASSSAKGDIFRLRGSCQDCTVYGSGSKDEAYIFSDGDSGFNVLYTMAGDDYISINYSNRNDAYGGTENDKFAIEGGWYNKLYGEAGDDQFTITGNSDYNSIYGGAGDDLITIENCNYNIVEAGEDSDTITTSGSHNTVYGQGGNDLIKIGEISSRRSSYVTAEGGSGVDIIRYDYCDHGTLRGGADNDIIEHYTKDLVLTQPHATKMLLEGGAGKDIYRVYTGGSVYIDATTGETADKRGQDIVEIMLLGKDRKRFNDTGYEGHIWLDQQNDIWGFADSRTAKAPQVYVENVSASASNIRFYLEYSQDHVYDDYATLQDFLNNYSKGKSYVEIGTGSYSNTVYMDIEFVGATVGLPGFGDVKLDFGSGKN